VLELDEKNQDSEASAEDDGNDETDQIGDEDYLFPTPDEVSNARAPEVGMIFSSLEESVRFVNVYAQLKGFVVIKGRNYKNVKITL
jgi:hypothetical protein